MSGNENPESLLDRVVASVTLMVTNATKVGGVYLGIHEIVTQSTPRALPLGVAVFMMTGAQVTEDALLNLASRVFGTKPPDPPAKSQGPQRRRK